MKRILKRFSVYFLLTAMLLTLTTFTINAETTDPGLVAQWKFDGNLNDATTNANNGASIGNITYTDAVLGQGAKLDGKSYIEVPDSDSLDLSSAFTMSMWIYKEPTDEGVPFITKMGSDSNENWPYGLYEWNWLSPTIWYGYEDEYGGISGDDVTSDVPIDIQKWTLLTVTFNGSKMLIYLNDVMVKSEVIGEITLNKSSGSLSIGFGYFMNKDQFFKGVIDDLRLYNKAIDINAINKLYADGTTGSGKDRVIKPKDRVAYYKFDGDGKDFSRYANNGSAVNSKGGITYITGMAGKAAKFNGASYFEIKDSDSLDLDSAFTIAGWFCKDTHTAPMPYLAKYGQSQDVKGKDMAYLLYEWNNDGGQELDLANFYQIDTENSSHFSSSVDIPAKKWYFYTATFDGSKIKQYIDNKLKQTTTYEDFVISHSAGPLWIGATTSTEFFKGAMDELSIYNYAKDANGIKAMYEYRDSISIVPVVGKLTPTTLKKGKTFLYKVSLKSIDTGKVTDITATSTYTTSNAKVAKVEKGKVTIVGKGKATVTATYGPHSKSFVITGN